MMMSWVIEGKLGASGMVHPDDVESLAASGIRAILSLTERNPFASGVPDALDHLHLPVADMTSPTRDQILRAIGFIRDRHDEEKAVLVHCLAGYGRTGTILACYLVAEGWDPDEAIREIRAVRPGSIETLGQEATVRSFSFQGD